MIRIVNRLLAFVLGAALAAGGMLVIIEGIWTWTNSGFVWIPGDQWLSNFRSTPWSDPLVIAISCGVAALGLLLLLIETWPHRPRFIPYHSDATTGEWLLLRRSAEAHLARRLRLRTPVGSVRARIQPRPLKWRLVVRAGAAQSTSAVLEDEARALIDALHAPPGSRIRVETTGAAVKQ